VAGLLLRPWGSLTTKLLATTMLVAIGVALATSTRATSQLATQLTAGFESKGEAIALALAVAAEQNAGSDISTVQGAIDANREIFAVKYIFIADAAGRPYAHTFTPSFPVGLEMRNTIALGEDLQGARVKVAHGISFEGPQGAIHAIEVAAPIAGGALGVVHVGMDEGYIDRAVADLRVSIYEWAGAVSLVGIALAWVIALFSVIRPVGELTRVTREIVRKGDLTQKITIRSRDEIGELASTFSEMVAQLREVPQEVGESTRLLARSVADLRQSAEAQGQMMTKQATALQETQVTTKEISQTSQLAAQKADAVLRYAERADNVSRSGEQAVEQSLAALTDIRARVEEIAQRITTLGERTVQIGNVTQTVKDLADQSNMLALNAAIEAVRAGEAGRGFAVVAREVRSMADQSIQATRQVREILDDVSAAVRAAVSITDKGAQRIDSGLAQVRTSGEKLTELSGIVKESSSAARQISAAVGQQNAGIAQIFGAVTNQNEMMENALKRIEATDRAIGRLSEVSKMLVQIVERFHV
jgi:methyl-accepting chemotaxis protein